jgi:putative component of membrane protein insertase Oxa1/YidC/SpoIIIJ protein YidD
MYICSRKKGLVVQLVRIHACHAWGRGFESRPDREKPSHFEKVFFYFY